MKDGRRLLLLRTKVGPGPRPNPRLAAGFHVVSIQLLPLARATTSRANGGTLLGFWFELELVGGVELGKVTAHGFELGSLLLSQSLLGGLGALFAGKLQSFGVSLRYWLFVSRATVRNYRLDRRSSFLGLLASSWRLVRH